VLFRLPVPVRQTGVGHSSVRVGLSSYSEAGRVYAAASLGRLPIPNSEEPLEATLKEMVSSFVIEPRCITPFSLRIAEQGQRPKAGGRRLNRSFPPQAVKCLKLGCESVIESDVYCAVACSHEAGALE
jgi:hypothetical protein